MPVSVSGYHAWKKRSLCKRKREDGELAGRIETFFCHHRRIYGSPRIHACLRGQGIRCGRKRVVRLMQQLHLCARRPRRRTVTTRSAPGSRWAENVLQQHFSASAPNQKWMADVTAIATQEGWLYLAAVQDLFSRAMVG